MEEELNPIDVLKIRIDELEIVSNRTEVRDSFDLEVATETVKTMVAIQKEIDRELDIKINEAFKNHKELVQNKKNLTNPLSKAIDCIKSKIQKYLSDIKAKEEALRKEKEVEAYKKAMAERMAEVDTFESKGLDKEAAIILDKPLIIPTSNVVLQTKVEGMSERENWTFEIIDESLIPREYMMPDIKKIGAYVKAMKKDAVIAGVKIISTKKISIRGN